MKTPTESQIKTAVTVLRYFGTIANMRGDIFDVDAFVQAIKKLEEYAARIPRK